MIKITKRGLPAINDWFCNPAVKLYTLNPQRGWVEIPREAMPRIERLVNKFPDSIGILTYGVE